MSLYGVYGSHTIEACPINNFESARTLVSFADSDLAPLLSKYRINKVLGQFHSAFEHTFLWILDAEDPHLIEEFALETGLAAFNNLKIVPLRSLPDEIIPRLREIHGL